MTTHDPITPHNFSVQVVGPEGDLVRVRVRVEETVPPGGIDLDVLWSPALGRAASVAPYRNLGRFIDEAIAEAAGGAVGH